MCTHFGSFPFLQILLILLLDFRYIYQKLNSRYQMYIYMMMRNKILIVSIIIVFAASQTTSLENFLNNFRNKQSSFTTTVCLPDYIYDPRTQRCKCRQGKRQYQGSCVEECSGGQVWVNPGCRCLNGNWNGQQCVVCQNGRRWVVSAQQCMCIENYRWNGQTCIGVFNEINECGIGRYYNQTLNRCMAINGRNCSGGRVLNRQQECICPTGIWNGTQCVNDPVDPQQEPKCPGAIVDQSTGQCKCFSKNEYWDGNSCRKKSSSNVESENRFAQWNKMLDRAEYCIKSLIKIGTCSNEQTSPKLPNTEQFRNFLIERSKKKKVSVSKDQYEEKILQLKKNQGYNLTQSDILLRNLRNQRKNRISFDDIQTSTTIKQVINDIENQKKRGKSANQPRVNSFNNFQPSGFSSEPFSNNLRPKVTMNMNSNRFLLSQSNQYPKVNEGNIQFNYGNAIFRITYNSGTTFYSHQLLQGNIPGEIISLCWTFSLTNIVMREGYVTSNGFLYVIYEDYSGQFVETVAFKLKLDPFRNCYNTIHFNGDFFRYYKKRGQYVSSRQYNNNLIIVTQCDVQTNDHGFFEVNENSVSKRVKTLINYGAQFSGGMVRHIWFLEASESTNRYYIEQIYNVDYTSTINFEGIHLYTVSSDTWTQQHQVSVVVDIRLLPLDPPSSTQWTIYTTSIFPGRIYHPFQIDQFGNRLRVFSRTFFPPSSHFFSYSIPDIRSFSANIYFNDEIVNSNPIGLSIARSYLFFDQYACLVHRSQIIVYNTINPGLSKRYPQNHFYQGLHKFGQGMTMIGFGRIATGLSSSVGNLFAQMFRIISGGILLVLDQIPNPSLYQLSSRQVNLAQNFYYDYKSILLKPEINGVIFGVSSPYSPFTRVGMYFLFATTGGCIGPDTPQSCPGPQTPSPFIIKLHGHPQSTTQVFRTERYTLRYDGGYPFIISSSQREIHVRVIKDITYPNLSMTPNSKAFF